jgi:hypothetical protein
METLNSKNVTAHRILPLSNISGMRIQQVFPAGVVDVHLPRVHQLCDGGNVRLCHPACSIYRISNAIQHPISSVIRIENAAIFEKTNRLAANKEIFLDQDIQACELGTIYLRNPENIIKVGSAFSLLGVHAWHWAHFLVQFLPKLIFSRRQIQAVGTIVVQKYLDSHIMELIRYNISDSVKIIEINKNEYADFDEMYFCSEVAYLCDHANYSSVSDDVIPKITRQVVARTLNEFSDNCVVSESMVDSTHIFIAFDGNRGAVNAAEVEFFFKQKGYVVVRPHLLTLKQKVQIFSKAERVVGIASSGMTNLFFCKKQVNVLMFINYERAFDTYMSQFFDEYPNLNMSFYVGQRVGKPDINSAYFLDLNSLRILLPQLGF